MGRSKKYDNGVHVMTAPCKNCTDRQMGCHGQCERYKAYREVMDEAGRKRYAAGEAEGLEIEGKLRIMKTRRLEKRRKGK